MQKSPNFMMFLFILCWNLTYASYNLLFFWLSPLFAIICCSFFVTNTVDLKLSSLQVPKIYGIVQKTHPATLSGSLEHEGEDCWFECDKQGKCDWCGGNGYCCRMGWTGNGCDGTFGGQGGHQCVLKPGKQQKCSHKYNLKIVLITIKN